MHTFEWYIMCLCICVCKYSVFKCSTKSCWESLYFDEYLTKLHISFSLRVYINKIAGTKSVIKLWRKVVEWEEEKWREQRQKNLMWSFSVVAASKASQKKKERVSTGVIVNSMESFLVSKKGRKWWNLNTGYRHVAFFIHKVLSSSCLNNICFHELLLYSGFVRKIEWWISHTHLQFTTSSSKICLIRHVLHILWTWFTHCHNIKRVLHSPVLPGFTRAYLFILKSKREE